jgi:phosphatidylglycerophosphate synthase
VRTILSFIAAPFFILGTHFNLLVGGVIVAAAFILDYVDGDLARLKNLESKKGRFFDVVSDRIMIILSIFTLSLGLFRNANNILDLVFGTIVISLLYISELIDTLLEQISARSLRETFNSELEFVSRLFRHFSSGNVYYFGEDFVYSLIIIGCIFNMAHVILILLIVYLSSITFASLYKIMRF